MNEKLGILLKCITLLHREKILNEYTGTDSGNSKELIRDTLETLKNKKQSLMGGDSEILEDLIDIVKDMIANPDNYDRVTLVEQLSLILKEKQILLETVIATIGKVLPDTELSSNVSTLRNAVNTFNNEQAIIAIFNKTAYELSTGNISKSFREHLAEVITNIEAYNIKLSGTETGVVAEMDFSSKDSIEEAMDNVKTVNTLGGRYITGFTKLNKLTGNGFRGGEQWVIPALQHNYKSGLARSLFIQMVTLNNPVVKDNTKKPCAVFISFEDDMHIIAEFIYEYLYVHQYGELPSLDVVTKKELAEFITSKLSAKGFDIKIIRVNPDNWTYKDIFSYVNNLESTGLEVKVLGIDYLSKLPTTGCIRTGPTGTDIRDLFNKVRNFCSSKEIFNFTPHQFSTQATDLTRAGIKNYDFLLEVANNNYYEGSRQIPQVVDGELYICKGTVNRRWRLFFGRGKHRTTNIIPDEDKLFDMPFPKKGPILEDLHGGNNNHLGNVTDQGSSSDEDIEFDF